MSVQILVGDCLEQLRSLPSKSVHTCICSPPYFRLRDYNVKGQIGLETTPAAFVKKLVAVFREVHRVLRNDGSLWVNMGDSYASTGGTSGRQSGKAFADRRRGEEDKCKSARIKGSAVNRGGLKPKDLIGIPWMLAFALRDDGWYLRQDIIWSKPNPMPESVKDRCTKSHEYFFLLTKSKRYYFDADSISEAASPNTHARVSQNVAKQAGSARAHGGAKVMKAVVAAPPKTAVAEHRVKNNSSFHAAMTQVVERRAKRSVWTVASEPLKEAHFAAYPPSLIVPCVLASCPPGGVVLDPFGGAGTTALVAERLGRDSIIIELNPKYAAMAQRRLKRDLARVSGADDQLGLDPLPLFDGRAA